MPWRSAWLAASSAALLAFAGCGGGEETPPAPRIDAAVAGQLAEQSDEIAALLDAGDVCGAAGRADDLKLSVDKAIGAGQVPQVLAADLRATADALVNEVNCPPPADEDKDGKDKKKKKGGEEEDD